MEIIRFRDLTFTVSEDGIVSLRALYRIANDGEAVDDESAGYPITALGEIKEVFREV